MIAGEVRTYVAEVLRERFCKQVERRRATVAEVTEIEAMTERRRQGKLAQLAEKFWGKVR